MLKPHGITTMTSGWLATTFSHSRCSEPLIPKAVHAASQFDHVWNPLSPTSTNMTINLSNYSYFFLDVHEEEAYLALVGTYSTVLLREEQQ